MQRALLQSTASNKVNTTQTVKRDENTKTNLDLLCATKLRAFDVERAETILDARHFGMIGTHCRQIDVERALEPALGLVRRPRLGRVANVLGLDKVKAAQLVDDRRRLCFANQKFNKQTKTTNLWMTFTDGVLTDLECTLKRRLRLGVVSLTHTNETSVESRFWGFSSS